MLNMLYEKCNCVEQIVERIRNQIDFIEDEYAGCFSPKNINNCIGQLKVVENNIESFKKESTIENLLNIEDQMMILVDRAYYANKYATEGEDVKFGLSRNFFKSLAYSDEEIDEIAEALRRK